MKPPEITLSIIFSMIASVVGLLSLSIIMEIKRNSENAMVKFHLNEEESIMDFKVFHVTNIIMTILFGAFFAGSILRNSLLIFIGEYSISIYSLVFLMLLIRWWRRF